ncbi:MAG TPA: hypothetical protein ENK06_03930 [Gammaproteobacteria bacterium]|nr:hypothetical protein [Gammaproteobacteria bacterium]
MSYAIRIFISLVFVLLLQACQGKVASNEEGKALAAKYVTAINEGRYDEAFQLVSDGFFDTMSKNERVAYYNKIKDIMGPVISVKLSKSLVDDRFSARFYMFQFSFKHENGITTEMVTMLQKINSKDPLKIFGHKVDSSKLKKLNASL